MKRLFSLLIALLLITSIIPINAQKAFRPVKNALKNKRPTDALKLIKALETDSTLTSNPRLYQYGVEINIAINDVFNEKMYLKQKLDTAELFHSIYGIFNYALKCDSIENRIVKDTNKKFRYRKKNSNIFQTYYKNLIVGNRYFFTHKDYKNTLRFSEIAIKIPKSALFNGQIDTPMQTNIQAAGLGLRAAYFLNDIKQIKNFAPLALQDTGINRKHVLEIMSKTSRQSNDINTFFTFARQGLNEFPNEIYFFSELIDYYIQKNKFQTALTLSNEMLLRNPNSPLFLTAKGIALQNLGHNTEAIEAYQKSLSIDTSQTDNFLFVGEAYCNLASKVELPTNIHSSLYKSSLKMRQEYFKYAENYLEIYRIKRPNDLERWAPLLYNVYLSLNRGNKFEEIEEIIKTKQVKPSNQLLANQKTFSNMSTSISNNPLFTKFNTPYNTIPFDKITLTHIEEAINEGMEREVKEVNAIINNPEKPSFENTIVAFDKIGELLGLATTIMYNLSSADTNDELDDLVERLSPVLTAHASSIMLNDKLFDKIKAVYKQKELITDKEDLMLLDKTYAAFENSGATLDTKGKEKFRELQTKLSMLTIQFSQNNLKETNEYVMHLTKKNELSGLPESQIEQAQQAAKDKGLDGWIITLKAPSYGPFMTYNNNRDLREKLYMAYNTLCTHDNNYNNFKVVTDIINTRRELAQLLGYPDYATYVLKRRMAGSAQNVNTLLNQLIENYLPKAKEEVKEVETFAKKLTGDNSFELQPWDFSYYSQKLQKERYNFDSETLRPYFELSKVIDGVFGLATKLYGITFKLNKDIPVYNPDVVAYEVHNEDGTFLSVLYCDFHPRDGKRSGAWMTNFKDQWMDGNDNFRPHVTIVMNFTRPTAF